MSKLDCLYFLLVGLFASVWNYLYSGAVLPEILIFGVVVAVLSTVIGRVFLRATKTSEVFGEDFFLSFPIGLILSNYILMFFQLFFPFSIIVNTIILMTVSFSVYFFYFGQAGSVIARREECFEKIIILLIVFLAASFWSQDSFSFIQQKGDVHIFKMWSDYFSHASRITTFRIPDRLLLPSYLNVVGMPIFFYHYASYLWAAVYASLPQQSALTALCLFHVPLGFALSGMAAYILGRSCWGSFGGIAAMFFLLLFPDPSFYGIRHPWYSYHWLQITSPAANYGITAAALALTFCIKGCSRSSWVIVGVGYLFAGLTVMLRAQVFAGLLPVMILYNLIFFQGMTRRFRVAVSLIFLFVFFSGVFILPDVLTLLPALSFSPEWAKTYLAQQVIGFLPEGHLRSLMPDINDNTSYLKTLIVGMPLIYFSTFGLFGLIYFIYFCFCRLSQRSSSFSFLPLLAAIVYLGMALGLEGGTSANSQEELQHRPFVFFYFVFAVWFGVFIAPLLARLLKHPARGRWIILAICLFALCVPFYLGKELSASQLSWGWRYTNIEISKDLMECAFFVRGNSAEQDIVQDSQNDPRFFITNLTERHSFLGYPDVGNLRGVQRVVDQRRRELTKLKELTVPKDVQEYAKSLGIDWYILRSDDQTAWSEEQLVQAVFERKLCSVYNFKS